MNNKAALWALQLIRYFIISKGYLQVSVVSNFKFDKNEIDYWLINEKNPNFPIIHISNDNEYARTEKAHFLTATISKIKGLIRFETGSILEISLNRDSANYISNDIQYIKLHPGAEVQKELKDSFPEISTIIYDVENIEVEKKKIVKELALKSIENTKKVKSERMEINFKEKLCFSFLFPATISIIIFVALQLFAVAYKTSLLNSAIIFGAYYKAYITIFHQIYRFLTAGFVHTTFLHLLFNLMALFDMANIAEKYYGKNITLLIMFLGIIIGNICIFIGNGNIIAVGLSGGIFAVFGAIIVMFALKGYFKIPSFRRQIFKTIYINIIISLMPGISLLGHLGGFVTGIMTGMIFAKNSSKSLKINSLICSIILSIVLGYMSFIYKDFNDFYAGTDYEISQLYQKMNLNKIAKKYITETQKYYKGE
ncbi:MAG: rhomboid family intramembrane serine protease [Erysipelotrichaceae bacterium]